jgi:hypothetical protein
VPQFNIKTLELFESIAYYEVQANTLEEAVAMIKSGDVAYESHEHPGNADQFIEVMETEEVETL